MQNCSEDCADSFCLFEVAKGLSGALDLLDQAVVAHHARVACLAHSIATEINLPSDERQQVLRAGLLHDIGAFSLKERLEFLKFNVEEWYGHSEMGFRLVKSFPPFSEAADLIRFHHAPWSNGRGEEFKGNEVPVGSHILHLADRVSVIIRSDRDVLGQTRQIREKIEENSGRLFMPELVEAFKSLCGRESFWLDVTYPQIDLVLEEKSEPATVESNLEQLESLAKLFCRIIDFRSRFTATHSTGVAAAVERLAALSGCSDRDSGLLRIAGYLHDIGKLGVPSEVLEKPGPLSSVQWNAMRKHPYLGYRVIGSIGALDTVKHWVAFHHERMDGGGYPFHRKASELPVEARILAVADIFTALAEDRPYRPPMSKGKAVTVLGELATSGAVDGDVLGLLVRNFDEVDSARKAAQRMVITEYESFYSGNVGESQAAKGPR